MDIHFFKKMIVIYTNRKVSLEIWKEFYNIMFSEIAKIKPDEVNQEHVELFSSAENFFASIEEFEKADILKKLISTSHEIFKTRERIENIKKDLINRNLN